MLIAGCAGEQPTQPTVPPKKDSPALGELVCAVVLNDGPRINRLLAMGSDINENIGTQENQITPLLAAIALGNEPLIASLLMHGASQASAYQGYSATDFADFLNLELATTLLDDGRP